MIECSPPTLCHMSHVTCHMSHVTCHVFCVNIVSNLEFFSSYLPGPAPSHHPLWNPVAFLAAPDEREISKPCPPNIGQGDNSNGRTTKVAVLPAWEV